MIRLLAIFSIALFVSSSGIAQEKGKPGKHHPPYVHTVIFYMKKDAPKGQTQKVIQDCHKLLAKIPSVKALWVGRPAKKSTPKVSVSDYDVGLMIVVDDYDGLQKYLQHPDHLEFVGRHRKHFERVLVYDFLNQQK